MGDTGTDTIDWFTPIGKKGRLSAMKNRWNTPGDGEQMERLLRALIKAFTTSLGKLSSDVLKANSDFYFNFDMHGIRPEHSLEVFRLEDADGDTYIGINESEWEKKFLALGFIPFNPKVLTDPGDMSGEDKSIFHNAKCLLNEPRNRSMYKLCKTVASPPPDLEDGDDGDGEDPPDLEDGDDGGGTGSGTGGGAGGDLDRQVLE